MGLRKVRVGLDGLLFYLEHGGVKGVYGEPIALVVDVFRDEIDRACGSCTIVFGNSRWNGPYGYSEIPFAEIDTED